MHPNHIVISLRVDIIGINLKEGFTSPPDYLTEAELIGKMEKHGIGTGMKYKQCENAFLFWQQFPAERIICLCLVVSLLLCNSDASIPTHINNIIERNYCVRLS